MNFNSTLFREMASAMKSNGLLAAGYSLISVGGSTYPHQAIPPWNSSDPTHRTFVIVRNSSGYYQIDPARFPGPGSSPTCVNQTALAECLVANHGDPASCGCVNGNEGMQELVLDLHALGFSWGSYSNEAGCQVPACNLSSLNTSMRRGFVDEDFDLMMNYWRSDYVMVDSVGSYGGDNRPYPKTDPRWWGWNKELLTLWAEKIGNYSRPVILHSCHNGCGSTFVGPTLVTAPCNDSDPSQMWNIARTADGKALSGVSSYFRDAGRGLCVGCGNFWGQPCANDALTFNNGSGHGAGLQACGEPCPHCPSTQQWNYSSKTQMLLRSDSSCLQVMDPGSQVAVGPPSQCTGTPVQKWQATPSKVDSTLTQFRSSVQSDKCLASGPEIAYPLDPWCAENNNMWRSSTDTLQTWGRIMTQVDSLVGLSRASGPGHWGFGDSLEIGVPGLGCLTWEESKTHLALFAVTSQPLFISNDVRPNYVQQRVIDLLKNPDMIAINQAWAGSSGDRVWTQAPGKEIWAKPLVHDAVGVVLFNRNGTTSPCFVTASIDAPCDNNATQVSGAQNIDFNFDVLPVHWMLGMKQNHETQSVLACNVRDVFAGPNSGSAEDLGRFLGHFVAQEVPPHGSRFLIINNCSTTMGAHTLTTITSNMAAQ